MESLWNTMISYIMSSLPTKEFEPSSMEYNHIYPTPKNVNTITSTIKKTVSTKLTFKSLRNVMLDTWKEYNNGYVFIIMQIALAVYCPSLALAIIYQSNDVQLDDQFKRRDLEYQLQTQCQKQQFIHQLLQFVQTLFQSVNYQSPSMQEMQQQQQQGQWLQQIYNQLMKQFTQQYQPRAIQISTQKHNNENGGAKVKITIQIPTVKATGTGLELSEAGQVHEKMVVWQDIIIITF